MKEFDKDFQKEEPIEIVAEQQQKKEVKLVNQTRKIPGLTLFEYNTKSFELRPAEFKKQDVILNTLDVDTSNKVRKHFRTDVKENCIYFQALNRRNAIKKLKKANLPVK